MALHKYKLLLKNRNGIGWALVKQRIMGSAETEREKKNLGTNSWFQKLDLFFFGAANQAMIKA